jgi:hypothetical protein
LAQPLYPEWNIAALTHVAYDVSKEVQDAMLAIADHGRIGERIDECYTQFNTSDYCDTLPFPSNFTDGGSSGGVRCDTSKEVALLALGAMAAGQFSSWQSTLSYMQLRSMQEAIGFISQNEEGDWYCVKSSEVYESVTCPAGQFIKSREEFERSCSDAGLECKEGYQCVCQPCYEPQYCIDSVKMFGRCVEYTVFLPSILVPIALLCFGICLFVVAQKSKEMVKHAEKAAQNERELNDFIA